MPDSERTRTPAHRARSTAVLLLALCAAAVLGVVLGYRAVAGHAAGPWTADPPFLARPEVPRLLAGGDAGGVGPDDGVVPDGVTVFDDAFPAVTGLDPELRDALRRAATEAAEDGIAFSVSSGWRSAAYQEQLLREAVSEHGSAEEAARWVATAETSPHVTGDAVDIGPTDAMSWLSAHGDAYGLCQIYGNEPWHYELRPAAVDDGCPAPYADPTHDPRMR
ncbi:M15 family metallopeptidase [Blastococcus litoris]|uniref:M15 family metallopeptidase n=1 Tax=Blastococcus litoris TaxID=2171622 RepID=UPI000E30A193|nr:M15 family metallopeptidase [Blastococcus litoris]